MYSKISLKNGQNVLNICSLSGRTSFIISVYLGFFSLYETITKDTLILKKKNNKSFNGLYNFVQLKSTIKNVRKAYLFCIKQCNYFIFNTYSYPGYQYLFKLIKHFMSTYIRVF